jgi:hypothetical protein
MNNSHHATCKYVSRHESSSHAQVDRGFSGVPVVNRYCYNWCFSGRVHGMRGSHGKHGTGSIATADTCTRAMDKAVSAAVDAAIDVVVREILKFSQIQSSSGVQKGRGARTC